VKPWGSDQGTTEEAWGPQGCTGFSTMLAYTEALIEGNNYDGRTESDSAYSNSWSSFSFHILPLFNGIEDITPTEFDYDASLITLDGNNFEATQGTGTVYLSDASTLAGSANEVDLDSAIATWANGSITLNLTSLSGTEDLELDTLGIGVRYFIVVNDNGDEYAAPYTVDTHRAAAFDLKASANIAASGEATTAQLTPPAGKTSGADFVAGRIQDDENPTDSITFAADEYTEVEWGIATNDYAFDDETYDFRLEEMTTFTVTPKVTISATPAATRRIFNL